MWSVSFFNYSGFIGSDVAIEYCDFLVLHDVNCVCNTVKEVSVVGDYNYRSAESRDTVDQ